MDRFLTRDEHYRYHQYKKIEHLLWILWAFDITDLYIKSWISGNSRLEEMLDKKR